MDPGTPDTLPKRFHGTPGSTLVIGIIARNEAARIGALIAALANQTLLRRGLEVTLIVFANGCSDDTAGAARRAIDAIGTSAAWTTIVHDTPRGGKSRSWNALVHQLAPPATDAFLFVDADITLADDGVGDHVLATLAQDPVAMACTGRPTKSIALADRKTWLDRLSLRVSENSRFDRAINGSLYCLDGAAAGEIWLPDDTPGEDGFLNAMVQTRGFSIPADPRRVAQVTRTTHYYEATPLSSMLKHEKRMILGTTINRWLFEYFWSLSARSPVGSMIDRFNREEPGWVEDIIAKSGGGRKWVVPRDVLLARLPRIADGGYARFVKRMPLGMAATAFNVVACLMANPALRRRDASSFW